MRALYVSVAILSFAAGMGLAPYVLDTRVQSDIASASK